MIIRVITGICGIVILVMAIRTKQDKSGRYNTLLKEDYTEASIKKYIEGIFYSESFFGCGLIVQAIFGSGIGYWIGSIICLLGLIILFVYMKKLQKKNKPYRKSDK